MKLHPLFKLREQHTQGILDLLDSTVLGTNGAHYRHLDTVEKMEECDMSLHLSMERNEKVLGNVTFCRRNGDWYVRYFAFSASSQSMGKLKSKSKSNFLKSELNTFFEACLTEGYDGREVKSFYAYIDPKNEKSLWMSETFGFKTIAEVATQTFSRVRPKSSPRLERLTDWTAVQELVEKQFGGYQYYFETQTKKPPFYVLRDDDGEILAMAKTSLAKWEIKRLPGKFGGVLTKMIPFILGLRKIIRPKNHTFIVPEAVFVKDNDPNHLTELFEGILATENQHLIIWWVDKKDELYSSVHSRLKWGLLHKIVGVSGVNVVCRRNSKSGEEGVPVYTTGIDFI